MLSDTDVKFIDRRRQLVDNWRAVGTAAIAVVLGLGVYLFWRSPLLINPHHVAQLIEAGSLDASTMALSAVMLPVVTISMFVLIVAMLIVMFRAFRHEGRFIAIIDELVRADHKRRDDE